MWIFSGERDPIAVPANQEAQRDYYTHFGANVSFTSYDIDHRVPTIFAEGTVDEIEFSELATGYDTVGNMLEYVLTNLQTTNPISSLNAGDTDYQSKGVLRRFSQWEFLDSTIL